MCPVDEQIYLPVSDVRISVFEASLGRCLSAGDFVQAFYGKFIASSPEVAEKFAKTDFSKQRAVLKNSLYLMARFALGMDDGTAHLEAIAETHSRKNLDITPGLYVLWLDCLVQTARDFDVDFDAEVELAWRELLEAGIARMVSVYRAHKTIPPVVADA